MFIVFFITALIFLPLAYLIGVKKQYMLISGINTSKPETLAKIDLESVCRALGKSFGFLGFFSVLCGILGIIFMKYPVFTLVMFFIWIASFFVFILGTIVYIQRYDKNNYDDAGKLKKRFYVLMCAIIAFTAVIMLFIAFLFAAGMREPTLTYGESGIMVSGMYHYDVKTDEIITIEKCPIPDIKTRVNGSSIGGYYKGNFKTADDGLVMISASRSSEFWIKITTEKKIYYYSANETAKTEEIINELNVWYEKIKNEE